MGAKFRRIDVDFARYRTGINSSWHKDQTHAASSTGTWEGWNLPNCEENKVDLALLLSSHLIGHSRRNKPVVLAGGRLEGATTQVIRSRTRCLPYLGWPWKADTRFILHRIHDRMETMAVSVRNTDVLLLPLAHFDKNKMWCTRLYKKAGTAKAPKYYPVHAIPMMLSAHQIDTLLAFHVVIGSDSVSGLVVMARKQPGRSFINITLTWLALGRVSHCKHRWHPQEN